jgi:hypothetical protein
MLIHVFLQDGNANDYTINVELYTIEGKRVYKKQANQNIFAIETNRLSAGIYILKLVTANGQIYNEKIVLY